MSVHIFVRFEPRPGKADEFREELLRVNGPSRDEVGCLGIQVFESLREPALFAIHSEWVDEAAFELHAQLPHTVRFLAAAMIASAAALIVTVVAAQSVDDHFAVRITRVIGDASVHPAGEPP